MRKHVGWAPETVARKARVHKNTYLNFERGDRGSTVSTLCRVARAYKVPAGYFLGEVPWAAVRELLREKAA